MRISSFDSYIESGAEVLKHLKNYRKIAKKIKEIARKRCGRWYRRFLDTFEEV